MLINDITDTARWVAVFRADENDRPNALFHDRFARKLAGEKGEAIANVISFSRKNSWAFVARTFLFDEYIQQHITEGYDTVINLAAGLDTRPYCMSLPASLKWIEIDFPEIINYKKSILGNEKPVCQLSSISLNLAEEVERRQLFEKINDASDKALVITEGLVGYLDDEKAASLSRDLAEQKNFRRWALDIMSPGLLVMSQKEMGSFLEEAHAPLQFAPPEGEEFFEKYGWKHLASKSKLKTAATLKRLPDEMIAYAAFPEPEGPKRDFPWSGVCLFENETANS